MCPYAEYGKLSNYEREVIICNKTKDICPFTRYCTKVNRMIPNDTMGDCRMKNEVEIPVGSSRVRKTVSNEKYLYVDVEINGKLYTQKIKNTLKDIPDYVYVQEGLDGYEIVENKPKTTRRR